jgi:hypothetical protein
LQEQFQSLEDNNTALSEVNSSHGLVPIEEPVRFKSQVTDSVDDLTSILAILQNQTLQNGFQEQIQPFLVNQDKRRLRFLASLASDLGLLRETEAGIKPARRALSWLKKSREEQLRDLSDAWTRSSWNELLNTPGLVCEDNNWTNDPISARTALLDVLPRDTSWYRLADLITQIKKSEPDFQRPDGNYNTWYIRDEEGGDYIVGFDNWDLVEGRLLHFLVTGPVVWLGMAEIDASKVTHETRFRITSRAVSWLANIEVKSAEVEVPIVVRNDASIQVPYNSSRFHRFQVARIANPQPVERDKPFNYRLSPRSLSGARDQGIEPERLKKFLEEASGRPIPPSTMRAIERWAEFGSEARLDMAIVLRVRDSEVLDKLRANSRTRPFIGEALGDMAVLIKQDDWSELVTAAAQLGLLLDTNEAK